MFEVAQGKNSPARRLDIRQAAGDIRNEERKLANVETACELDERES